MKKLVLALHIFSKQKLLNFLIIVEMALVLFVIGVTLNRIEYITKNDVFIKQAAIQNSLNFIANDAKIDETTGEQLSQAMPKIKEIIQTYHFVEGISDINEYSIKSSKIDTVLYTYDTYSIKRLHFLLNNGEWIKLPTEHKNGRVPVIALSNSGQSFKKGDIIKSTIEIYNKQSDIPQTYDIEFEIIGMTMVDVQNLFFPDGVRSSTGELNDLFTNIIQGKTVLLAHQIDTLPLNKFTGSVNVIIYIKQGTPLDQIKTLQQELSEYGQTDLISDMQQNSKMHTNEKIRKDFPTFAILTVAALTGFVSASILNTHQQLRRISIWLMNGLSYKQVAIIYGLYNTILLSFSFIIYYGLMTLSYYLDGRGHYYFYFIRTNHTIISSAILVTIVILVTLGCMGMIKRKGLFEYYYD